MPQIYDDVTYLSQEIGPRPAGTEEEQQAALYITEQFQKGAGLPATMDDFKCASDSGLTRLLCFAVALVAALIAFFVNVAAIPAVIVGLIAAVLYVLELVDRPVLSRFFVRGMSQNVIAKYEPGQSAESGRSRRRKVILVANYDSGKAQPELQGPIVAAMPILRKATDIAIVAVPVLALIRTLAFTNSASIGALLFNVLIIVGMILMVLPVARYGLGRMQSYNNAANCNAAGVAVLMEVARRVGNGRVSEAELAEREAIVHGEDAARAEGLVPEGARLEYEVEPVKAPEMAPQSEEARLAAAKAAIAAMTGKEVPGAAAVADISSNLVQVEPTAPDASNEALRREQNQEIKDAFTGAAYRAAQQETEESAEEAQPTVAASAAAAGVAATQVAATAAAASVAAVDSVPAAEPPAQPEPQGNVPDWYLKAQARAKKKPHAREIVHRSRYGAALAATEAKLREQEQEFAEQQAAAAAAQAQQREQERLRAIEQQRAQAAAQAAAEEAARQRAAEQAAVEQAAMQAQATQMLNNEQMFAHIEESAQTTVMAPTNTVSRETSEQVHAQMNSSVEQDVSRETEEQPRLRRYDVVSRETSERRVPEARSVPEDVKEPETTKARSTERQTVSFTREDLDSREVAQEVAAQPMSEATSAIAPIDVSDLLQEMADMKTEEPKAPTFMDGMQQDAMKTKDSDSSESLSDPNAPFIPRPRTGEALKEAIDHPEKRKISSAVAALRSKNIVLPDLPQESKPMPPLSEITKQRAPLAEVTENKAKNAARTLLSTVIPDISGNKTKPSETGSINKKAKQSLASLPSLSGELRAVNEEGSTKEETPTVSTTGSFATSGATSSFNPVGDELVANVEPDDLYVTDADDSDYAENFTETGAFAGPGYVDMPKSRMQKLFGRFGFGRKKKHEEEISAHEWLDVDEDFNARDVGRNRGGWESFQGQDAYEDYTEDSYGETKGDTGDFSPMTAQYADGSDFYGDDDQEAIASDNVHQQRSRTARPMFDAAEIAESLDDADFDNGRNNRWNGGALSSDRAHALMTQNEETGLIPPEEAQVYEPIDEDMENEFKQIYQFRHPEIDTEVWFVALGSELSGNAGMKELLATHRQELKGAIVINLEALGDGTLTFMQSEGLVQRKNASSRMKRIIKKASQATGITCATGSMLWRDSAAAIAMNRGVQAMSLIGMNGSKPAHFADAKDDVENVSEEKLLTNADFVMSILKNI